MASVTSQLVPLESNFLVPNVTFVVELVAFALLFFLLAKFVIPPINRAMTARQEAIRSSSRTSRRPRTDASKAEEEFKAQIADARHEAARIREEAREQGAAIIAEMREQAQAEADRIVEHAHTQIEAERKAAVASLRAEVGTLATTLAGRIVGRVPRGRRRVSSRVVDRFLADLETLETARPRRRTGRADAAGASADALAELTDELGSARTLARRRRAGRRAVRRRRRCCGPSPALRRVATDASLAGRGEAGPGPRASSGGKVDDGRLDARRPTPSRGGGPRSATCADALERLGEIALVRLRSATKADQLGTSCSRVGADARRRTPTCATRSSDPAARVEDKEAAGRHAPRRQGAAGDGDARPSRRWPAPTAPSARRSRTTARWRPQAAGERRGHRPGGRAARRRRPDAPAAALGQAVRPRRSTSTWSSTPTSSAASASRSVTTSSTAPSPAASTTPAAASSADRHDHGTTSSRPADRQESRDEDDGALDPSGGDPRRAAEVRRGLQARRRPARKRSAPSPRPATASPGSTGLPSAMANELLEFEDGTLGIALNLDTREIGVVILGDFDKIEEGQPVRRTGEILSVPVGDNFMGRVDRPARHPDRRPRRDRGRGPPRPRDPGARRDGTASRCTSRSPPASRRSTR